jgi:AcrR family transcriptional regulator
MAATTLQTLREDGREKRRELILLAAQKLFSKKGISGVSMRDIAREAGVSIGFIYRYFSGQTDVFVELFEARATELVEQLDTALAEGGPEPYHRLARTYVNYLHENSMFYEMMIHFMLEGNLSDTALNRVNAVLRRLMDRLEMVFSNENDSAHARTLAHSFFSSLNGVMISLANYPGRTPRETRERTLLLAETIADKFADGPKKE